MSYIDPKLPVWKVNGRLSEDGTRIIVFVNATSEDSAKISASLEWPEDTEYCSCSQIDPSTGKSIDIEAMAEEKLSRIEAAIAVAGAHARALLRK